MAENHPKGQETLWEMEKLLVTINFSFFNIVFKRLVLRTRKNKALFWERVNSLPNNKILALTKLKAFAGNKYVIMKMIIFAFDGEQK